MVVTVGAFRLDRAEGGESGVLGPGEVDVVLDIDYTLFTPSRLRVREGTQVRFVLRNHDPIRHELILGPPDVHARHATGTEAVHPPRPGEVTVEPNATASTHFQFDEAGAGISPEPSRQQRVRMTGVTRSSSMTGSSIVRRFDVDSAAVEVVDLRASAPQTARLSHVPCELSGPRSEDSEPVSRTCLMCTMIPDVPPRSEDPMPGNAQPLTMSGLCWHT